MRKHRIERLEIVKELVALGFEHKNIAQALGVSIYAVRADMHSINKLKQTPERPRRKDVFRLALKQYAQLAATDTKQRNTRDAKVQEALAKLLKEKGVLVFLQGVEMTMSKLMTPEHSIADRPYLKLLEVIFGRIDTDLIYEAEKCWKHYLQDVARMPSERIPSSPEILKNELVEFYVSPLRNRIAPTLMPYPGLLKECLDKQLNAALTQRDENIIRRIFGLDGRRETLRGIGLSLNVSGQRIRDIESNALFSLRKKAYEGERKLSLFIAPTSNVIQERLELREKEVGLRTLRKRLEGLIKTADTRTDLLLHGQVSELELSVRSANCLEAANIITIKDLVTKTENEMLKYRNFGRKALNEIKMILKDMGLSFGMKFE